MTKQEFTSKLAEGLRSAGIGCSDDSNYYVAQLGAKRTSFSLYTSMCAVNCSVRVGDELSCVSQMFVYFDDVSDIRVENDNTLFIDFGHAYTFLTVDLNGAV